MRQLAGGSEEKNDSRDGENPNREMEVSVLRVLPFEVFDGGWLAGSRGADHMMPAENLMKDNPVEKASQAQAEDQAGAAKRRRVQRRAWITASAGM